MTFLAATWAARLESVDALPAVASAALSLAILWRVAGWMLPAVNGSGMAVLPGSAGSGPAADVPAGFDLRAIVDAHLFGVPVGAVPQGPQPLTDASLVLTGTIFVVGGGAGLAILGESAASARVVRVGGEAPGGYRLLAVQARHVVLERGGAQLILAIPTLDGRAPAVAGAVPEAPGEGGATSLGPQTSGEAEALQRQLAAANPEPAAHGRVQRLGAEQDAAVDAALMLREPRNSEEAEALQRELNRQSRLAGSNGEQ